MTTSSTRAYVQTQKVAIAKIVALMCNLHPCHLSLVNVLNMYLNNTRIVSENGSDLDSNVDLNTLFFYSCR